MRYAFLAAVVITISSAVRPFAANPPAALPAPLPDFVDQYCSDCHDNESKKGGFDVTALNFNLSDPRTFSQWVKVHDRVVSGEMPPKKEERPEANAMATFLKTLADPLVRFETTQLARTGRATQRRLNRYEYENAVRDLLETPWLELRDALPEDGEANRFNKSGTALDVSHVQMSRYMAAADFALRQVFAHQVTRPEARTIRYYTRDQRSYTGSMKYSEFNMRPERATFPLLGTCAQPEVASGKEPLTVGDSDPVAREKEAVGLVASSYEPIEPTFDKFSAPASGRYRLRLRAYSVWVGPGKDPKKWFIPNYNDVAQGRRPEPVTLYSQLPPRSLRWLGKFDVGVTPETYQLETYLLEGESIRPDAARLFRSRPSNYVNPLARADGQPGLAVQWLEVEGPLFEQWPTSAHRLLFGDLPLRAGAAGQPPEVVSSHPRKDAERLLRIFMAKAYRRPVVNTDVKRFLPVIENARATGSGFAEAMIAGYTAVLCSPSFLYLEEKPGVLDDYALASRLSFFLWNSSPDAELRRLASQNRLHDRDVLRAQTDRMLNDRRSRQFVDAFLAYWLDLRKMNAVSPDAELYPDYYLDDLLTESAIEETQLFFAELLRTDLPARNLVASDFIMANERLAEHYKIPGVSGVQLQRVKVPMDSVRGGLLTQASVLKVTANGTTTSPVIRGAWVMERILGRPVPPPPASVPAVEPDIRGATTIREQLAQHRSQESCSTCHAKMDPAGFALENFDVFGGFRERYRALDETSAHEDGIGKNGQRFTFHRAQAVDSSGELPDGRTFSDIRAFKQLLLADQRQIARNMTQQLLAYGTGAAVRFGDRPVVERILDQCRERDYGMRSLLHAIVQSQLFLQK
ncbi:MAG: DUF1592 domain-containing protein [Opitutus sp.]